MAPSGPDPFERPATSGPRRRAEACGPRRHPKIVPALLFGSEARATAPIPGRRRIEDPIPNSNATGRETTGFDRFHLLPELRRAVLDCGYDEPRPVQAAAIPPALEGHDVLGLAQTGTGKTAAFVLPILQRLIEERTDGPTGVRALVLTPTRELAGQVGDAFESLGAHSRLRCARIFGGVPIARQVRALRARPEVVVACPGRLLDLMGQGIVRLDQVRALVLDEADHMFDMGFLPDLRRILNALPSKRQNLMFSATMPPEVRKLAEQVLHSPVRVELAEARPADTVEHVLVPVAEERKLESLEQLLGAPDFRSAIVFARTKHRARRLADKLHARGHGARSLQGNMTQSQRERTLQGFRDGRFEILVATDIAARGLDVAGVSHVVNFDVPGTPDAYTHRIGRTGRSEQSGRAFTFVTPAEGALVRTIEKRLGRPIDRVRPEALLEQRPPADTSRREPSPPVHGIRVSTEGAFDPRGPSEEGGGRQVRRRRQRDNREREIEPRAPRGRHTEAPAVERGPRQRPAGHPGRPQPDPLERDLRGQDVPPRDRGRRAFGAHVFEEDSRDRPSGARGARSQRGSRRDERGHRPTEPALAPRTEGRGAPSRRGRGRSRGPRR